MHKQPVLHHDRGLSMTFRHLLGSTAIHRRTGNGEAMAPKDAGMIIT